MPDGQMRLMRTKSKPLSNQTETVREVANKLMVSHTAIENYLKWLGLVKILDIWVQHEIHLKRVSTWDLLLKCKKIFILKPHCHWKWKWVLYNNVNRKRSWSKYESSPVVRVFFWEEPDILCICHQKVPWTMAEGNWAKWRLHYMYIQINFLNKIIELILKLIIWIKSLKISLNKNPKLHSCQPYSFGTLILFQRYLWLVGQTCLKRLEKSRVSHVINMAFSCGLENCDKKSLNVNAEILLCSRHKKKLPTYICTWYSVK